MDNLFGKDDSGNDSDSVENSKKRRLDDSIEIEEHDIKPEVETSMLISNSPAKHGPETSLKDTNLFDNSKKNSNNNSNNNNNSGPSNSKKVKLDVNTSNKNVDLFHNEIVIPQTAPNAVKERRESKEKNRRELEEEEREKMRVLVSNFTEDQLHRYEMYRRAAFPKAAIKRIMQTITGCSVSQNVVIAMSGIAKVYVGEIVEEALDVSEEWDDNGPVQPKHLREAVRRLRLRGKIPIGRTRKAFSRI